jgi:ribonuclease Z
VDHGLECVGFRVEQGNSALTFSSDTRPCPNVVDYARGANLLVHEAYSADGDAESTHTFGHSTAAEAGRAAHEARVGCLVLTHLREQRFADAAVLAAEAKVALGGPVELARDLDVFDF